jgi:hypothetical protein
MERRWPLERVIFALAGSMTLLSVVLALFVSPWFLLLTVFVGLNQWLFVAAGWCPLLQRGDAHLLDLRTQVERRRYGAPPGALAVSLARYILNPKARERSTSASTPCARRRRCATALLRPQVASSPGAAPGCRSTASNEPLRGT